LAQAFPSFGPQLIDVDAEDYLPWRWEKTHGKDLARLLGRVWVAEYNQAVLKQAASGAYDFVLVYKGHLLKPEQ